MIKEQASTVTMIMLTTSPDGTLGIVLNYSMDVGHKAIFARTSVTSEWMTSLVDVLGNGALSFGAPVRYPCRIRVLDDGFLLGLGRADGSHWFEVQARPESEPEHKEAWPGWTEGGAQALKYLNKARAVRGRRDLDPNVAGYDDDDIIADALHYGWEG
jgi:hypothetical protein